MKRFKISIIIILAAILFIPGVMATTKYSVKFNKNGGSGKTASVTCTTNKNCKLTTNSFKRTGYTFVGWNTKKNGTGKTYKNKQKVKNITNKKSITLYAQWKANKYTIKFNGNGATSGSTKEMNAIYDRKTTLRKNRFKRTGYTFVGWNTKKNGKGTTYKDGKNIKNLATKKGAIVTLYAMWKPITYTIKYNGNGSTSGETKDSKCKYNNDCKIASNSYKKRGYTFIGWNTKADGKGKSYSAKQLVKNLTTKNEGTVELYAMWSNNNKEILGTWSYNNGEEVLTFTDNTFYPDVSDKEESPYYVEDGQIILSGASIDYKMINNKLVLGDREFIKIK